MSVLANFYLQLKRHAWLDKIISSLGGRTIMMLTVALLINMASIAFNDHWIASIELQTNLIGQIRKNLVTLNTARTNLFSAESAQRGYLLTQRPEYLEPYKLALSDAKRHIQVMNDLEIKTPEGQPIDADHLALLAATTSLEAKSTEMKIALGFIEKNQLSEARKLMNLDNGMFEMNKFMLNTKHLIDNEDKYLGILVDQRKNSIVLARASLIGGNLILIFLVVLVIKQLLEEISVKSHLQNLLVKHNKLNDEKLEQQATELSGLAYQYLSNVEEERHKLSRELHDEMGSILTATKMDVTWVMKKLKDDAPDIVQKLKRTNTYIDQGINLKREIVEKLHPSVISTLGFWPALRLLIEDVAERNQWKLTLSFPDGTPKIDDIISLIAYRVVQETLNNASKYAKASTIAVDIMADEKTLKLTIEDNGIGFDIAVLDTHSHGLAGMRHRVMSIGGRFEISSLQNQGVITRVQLPINKII